jgi:hypothetical protein
MGCGVELLTGGSFGVAAKLGFPVTRALRVVSLDKRQECDEEVPICHKNRQECGTRASSPAGPSMAEKGSMTRHSSSYATEKRR